ncbi:MAG: hypothetical protein NT079_00875 [Candidatus Omnitrophica bacterium]|nr:hypothetical protein [Candidatus Omnitrophota bacterium]
MQDYLNSVVWDEVLPQECLFRILQKMRDIGILSSTSGPDSMYAYVPALPHQISENLTREMISSQQFSLNVMKAIIEVFASRDESKADSEENLKKAELKEYLSSEAFITLPRTRKVEAVLKKLKELSVVPSNLTLSGGVRAYLEAKLTEQIFANKELVSIIQNELFDDESIGKNAIPWLKRHQLSVSKDGIVDHAAGEILKNTAFRNALEKEKEIYPLHILRAAIEDNIFLGTASLRLLIDVLREKAAIEFPREAAKIRTCRLPVIDYVAFMAGLKSPKIKESLKGVKEPYRMFTLLVELQKLGIWFSNEQLSFFYTELPMIFADGIEKRSIRRYLLNVSEVAVIKKFFEEVQPLSGLLADKDFLKLKDDEKIDKMYDLLMADDFSKEFLITVPSRTKGFFEDFLKNFNAEDKTIATLRVKAFEGEGVSEEGIANFLVRHKPTRHQAEHGFTEEAAKAFHAALHEDGEKLLNRIKSGEIDFPAALITFAVAHKINLGTSYVGTFILYYQEKFPEDAKDVLANLKISRLH